MKEPTKTTQTTDHTEILTKIENEISEDMARALGIKPLELSDETKKAISDLYHYARRL